MIDSKYCRIVSGTVLSEQVKIGIKNKAAESRKKKTEVVAVSASDAKKRRRIRSISLVAALLVLVIGLSAVILPVLNIFNVKSPIPQEELLHMADVAENAQYLPNADILASSGYASALGDVTVNSDADAFYDESLKMDSQDLRFTLENYRVLNDSLANISSTATSRKLTIYDVKEEVQFALDIIPGYDQWFKVPRNMPYLSEEKERAYAYNSYRISYDKESGNIVMERVCNNTSADTYDTESGTYYGDETYQRQYLKVEYGFDDEGNEVVDCTVIDYLCVDNVNYYPIAAQKVTNVKDRSLTKYAATYMRSYNVADPSAFGNNKRMFDLGEMYDYGVNTILIQLNYESSDDISFIKTYYEAPDGHYGTATLGELTYYRKTPQNAAYFTAGWDNREDDWEEDVKVYNDVDLNGRDVRGEVIRTFAYTRGIRINMLCDECKDAKPSADGVFIDCIHGTLLDHVNRAKIQLMTDGDEILADHNIILDGITDLYAKAASVLGIDTAFTLQSGENFFEESVNAFCVTLGKDYHRNKVTTFDFEDIDKGSGFNSATMIDEERAAEYMNGKY